MKRILALVAPLVAALVAVPGALAATSVQITSPADGVHSLTGIVQVGVTASATAGVYGVQLNVDGAATGSMVTSTVGPYEYVIPWDTSGVAVGTHTLTVTAMDWSQPFPNGQLTTSAPITVDVGPPYPTISLDSPKSWTLVHGTTTVAATVASSVAPTTVTFAVDGAALTSSGSTASWDTTASGDGTHTLTATVLDGRGKTAVDSATVTVDNTPPTASVTKPAAGTYAVGSLDVQADASDAYGIGSVSFTIDGTPVGSPVTAHDSDGPYTYSATLPLAGLADGPHALRAVATDAAGNTSTSDAVTFNVGYGPPSVAVASPGDWTFAHGSVPVTATVSGGQPPVTATLVVDGAATTQQDSSAPYSFQWSTTGVTTGTHTLAVSVRDAAGRTATSAAVHVTVDNVAPTVAVSVPVAGSYALGTLAATATASDAYGIAGVQFQIDGKPIGTPVTSPDAAGGYTYSETLDISALANGPHLVTAVATDRAGNTKTSASVSFTVGIGPPSVTVTVPPDWTFGHGTTPVTVTVTGGQAPVSVQALVDGKAVSTALTAPPYTFQWLTTSYADGTHLLTATAVDALGRTATSPAVHVTVDNTAPSGFWIAPAAGAKVDGTVTLTAHGSDAYGVRSVQFLVDGNPVGAPVTSTSGGAYTYALAWDSTTVPAGTHALAATITDNAGNTTTLAATSVTTGPIAFLPVLNYHEINPPDGYSIYDETPAEADAQLAYLKANGYQSVTLEQYQAWLSGSDIGIAKPVLITVDDGLRSERAWDPLLQKYGFKAVMFVVTGLADNNQPGGRDSNNMSWADIQKLAANGRWQIALHAGQYGHGDYDSRTGIGKQRYSAACPYFYSCLSYTTVLRKTVYESVAAYKTAVTSEVTKGLAELKQKVPSASTLAWAAPFNDAGQWTNLYNDPSGQVQAWMPGYFASLFPIVFTQTNPVTYGQASGTVGSLTGFGRHYRFEVHTNTTIAQFATALSDPAFAR